MSLLNVFLENNKWVLPLLVVFSILILSTLWNVGNLAAVAELVFIVYKLYSVYT